MSKGVVNVIAREAKSKCNNLVQEDSHVEDLPISIINLLITLMGFWGFGVLGFWV